jgi:hypothetical protein
MTHVRPPHSHHWLLSISLAVLLQGCHLDVGRNWCSHVKCLARGDSFLHIGVCCKSLASQVLKYSEKLQINGVHTAKHTCDWVMVLRFGGYGPPSLKSWSRASDFHCFGSFRTCNTCWLEAICHLATNSDTSFFCVGMQALVAWWDR